MYLELINKQIQQLWRATRSVLPATAMCLVVPLANAALPVGWKEGQLAAVKGSWSLNSNQATSVASGSTTKPGQNLIVQLYSYNSRIPLSPVSIGSLDELQVIESASDEQWLAVTVNTGFPGWVAASDVVVGDNQTMQVSAQRTRLLITPEPGSRYLITLRKDYQAPVLSAEGLWVQTLAPASLRLLMKTSDYRTLLAAQNSASADQSAAIPAEPKENAAKESAAVAAQTNTAASVPAEQVVNSESSQQVKQTQNTESATTVQSTTVTEPSVSAPAAQNPVNQNPTKQNNAATVGVDYRLTPGDVITISVFGEPDMTVKEQRIPETGTISFPLIGAVNVKGRSPIDVQNDIEGKLAAGYLRDPEVNIAIVSYRPLFVRGAVISPGAFEFTEGLTVTKVLALAGGVGKQALRDAIKLYRGDQLFLQNLTVDSQVLIQPGDIVVVDEADETLEEANRFVYLHGEVNNPGSYPFRRGLTVEKAIALAGGFGPRASRKKINISREIAGQEKPEKLKKVELYRDLQPGDVISVGASWF